MKRKMLVFLLVVALSLTACKVPRESEEVPTPHPFDVAWDDRTAFGAGLIEAERAAPDHLPDATVYHIDLRIPDDLALLQGSEQIRYTNRESTPLDEVYLRLFPNVNGGEMTVSAVKVDGRDVQPGYEFIDTAVHVPLPTALQPGEHVIIELDFASTIPAEMGGNYGLFGYFDDVLVLDTFYPAVAVYDDEGWNVGIPSANGDLTYYDASFYLVRITVPADLTVVASGIEVGRESEDERQVLTFAAGPARDFYVAASDRFTVVGETVGETTIHSYALEEYRESAELALQFATDALKNLNARLGAYPYTEFDVVSTPMRALGIEYPGIVGITLREYDPDYDFDGVPSRIYLESTVAHEVGHQWFYNVVGNDQVDEPWLDEAVTQYVTWLYYVDVYGEKGAEGCRSSWADRWKRVDGADIPIGLPAGAYDGKEYGAIVYGRGPLFVTALAEEVGQKTFDAFLRDYYQSYKWDIGTGDAFRELVEEHCQCDLSALFEAWVYEKMR